MVEKIKLSPYREKYVASRPIVSMRIPVEVRDKIRQEAAARDMKVSKYLAELYTEKMDLIEEQNKRLEEAYKNGYEEGYAKAKKTYEMIVPCRDCGRSISVGRSHFRNYGAMVDALIQGIRCNVCSKNL